MNHITLSGTLKNKELKSASSGLHILEAIITVQKSKEEFQDIPFIAYGSKTKILNNIQIGKKIYINGSINANKYKSNNGIEYNNIKVVAHDVSIIIDENQFESYNNDKNINQSQEMIPEGFAQLDEDIPF